MNCKPKRWQILVELKRNLDLILDTPNLTHTQHDHTHTPGFGSFMLCLTLINDRKKICTCKCDCKVAL